MTYAQAIEHLQSLGPELPGTPGAGVSTAPPRKFDLAHMRTLARRFGDPHLRLPSILIAGTNGKGSTAATLASILRAAGYRVGLYTSPHLSRVNERIQIARPAMPSEYGALHTHGGDGVLELHEIPDGDFALLYGRVEKEAAALVAAGELPHLPSFFERLTMIAFLFFTGFTSSDRTPLAEVLVLEVGLGGRLDATNIVEPLFAVLTDIALDHQNYLGETLREIAGEKCGILRENGSVVTLAQHPEANDVIGHTAARLHVRGIDAAPFLPPALRNHGSEVHSQMDRNSVRSFELRNRYQLPVNGELLEIDSPLRGAHQQRNLALAIASSIELRTNFGYNLANAAIEAGIRETRWPGRLEWLAPGLLVDVAHNPAGAWTLRAFLASLPEERPRTLLFSCLRDKCLAEMSRILFPLFDASSDAEPSRRQDHLVLTPIPNVRSASLAELEEAARQLQVPSMSAEGLAQALEMARALTPPGGLIVATGSVYLVGAVRDLAAETLTTRPEVPA